MAVLTWTKDPDNHRIERCEKGGHITAIKVDANPSRWMFDAWSAGRDALGSFAAAADARAAVERVVANNAEGVVS